MVFYDATGGITSSGECQYTSVVRTSHATQAIGSCVLGGTVEARYIPKNRLIIGVGTNVWFNGGYLRIVQATNVGGKMYYCTDTGAVYTEDQLLNLQNQMVSMVSGYISDINKAIVGLKSMQVEPDPDPVEIDISALSTNDTKKNYATATARKKAALKVMKDSQAAIAALMKGN
ncbi:MAG UNVERIFIED_CONTAM: hypothetical protein LVT10_15020 [Anaerolineae bacterium]